MSYKFGCDPEEFYEKYPDAKLKGNLHLGDGKEQQLSVDALKKLLQGIEQQFRR